MVSVDDAFEVRLKKDGEQFEIIVDFDELKIFKKTPDAISVYDVVADTKIFKDQKKGDVASEQLLSKVFGSKTEEEIIKIILLEGECQIPTAYLNKMRDEKKSQIINYISEQAINPQTKSKYTSSMIEGALSNIHYNIDPNKDFVFQAEEVVKLLKKELPISMNKILLLIKIPGQFCGAFYGEFRKKGTIKKEFFDDHGNLHMHFEISENRLDDVANYIKNHSNGEGEYSRQEQP